MSTLPGAPGNIPTQVFTGAPGNIPTRTVTIKYFAWVRERIGRPEERIDVPADIGTVADLMTWLKTRGPEYGVAFERADVIRAAIDQAHATSAASITGAREIAFFPPVTGG